MTKGKRINEEQVIEVRKEAEVGAKARDLALLIAGCGTPGMICSGNGTEHTSNAVLANASAQS